ncbi:MAG TPA: hypothetical protein VHM90_06210, partial [Phycisphaerae bacterium]|nr:hypothetical protein [Phycisphaerae bacterium]
DHRIYSMANMSRKKSRLLTILLILAAAALPASFIPDAAFSMKHEPGTSWKIGNSLEFEEGCYGYTGGGAALYLGSVAFFSFRPAVNPKPPLPPPWLSQTDVDQSGWIGSLKHEIGAGSLLLGSPYTTNWEFRSGFILPFWPLSMFAAMLLFFEFRRWRRNRASILKYTCPTCSYDLRGHRLGDKCPECGTVVQDLPKSVA